jgi:hypothetical protein
MPTTNTNFTSLITAIDTKAQALAASTTDPKDLVFLGKAVEALNVADTVSAVITEGDTQVAAIAAQGATQVAAVAAQGSTYAQKSLNLSDIADANVALSNLGFATLFSTPTAGQAVLYDAALNKWINDDLPNAITVLTTNPAYNSGNYSLGAVAVNSTTGEVFVCIGVDNTVTPTEYIWDGTDGTVVGVASGEKLFVNENYQGFNDAAYADWSTTFTIPDGITSFCAVCVGGGGGGTYTWPSSAGAGGALAWANDISVTPGEVLTVNVGRGGSISTHGGDSDIRRADGTVIFGAEGGRHGAVALASIAKPIAGSVTPGNNSSGRGGLCGQNGYGGGGGAGGYSGNGGNGRYSQAISATNPANTLNPSGDGTGGAASGGTGYQSSTYGFGGGGGVGLYGEGPSGLMRDNPANSHSADMRHAGRGGSGGEEGVNNHNQSNYIHGPSTVYSDGRGYFGDWDNVTKSFPNMSTDGTVLSTGSRSTATEQGGHFGGGAGGSGTSNTNITGGYVGGMGGVRILFGAGRAFPSTQVFKKLNVNKDGTTY